MCNVVVTHSDTTQITYTNYCAGISMNDGSGWKLCLIPDLSVVGGPTQPLVVPLVTGDTYQTTGTVPSQALYPGYFNLMSTGVVAPGRVNLVTFTPPPAPVTDAPLSACSLVVNHADGSVDTYPNCMAGISAHDGRSWSLSVMPNKFRARPGDSYLKPFSIVLRNGDAYQVTGTLPPAWALFANFQGSPLTMRFTALPAATVISPPTVVQRA
jgi:hypothetical protein